MTQLLTQNSKLKKTAKVTGIKVFNFGIPAFKTQSGKSTCPFAGDCVKFCYAQKGAYIWGNVKPAFEWRYEQTKKENFAEIMQQEIDRKKPEAIRVHDSGDYYSPAYRDKWFAIMYSNPNVHFYSYTNSVAMFKGVNLPKNFTVIFSDSGKQQHLIDTNKDRHTKIFKSKQELDNAGYIDASQIDLYASKLVNPTNNKIGLIFH